MTEEGVSQDTPLLQCPLCARDFEDTKSLHTHMEDPPRRCLVDLGLSREEWRRQFRLRQKRRQVKSNNLCKTDVHPAINFGKLCKIHNTLFISGVRRNVSTKHQL